MEFGGVIYTESAEKAARFYSGLQPESHPADFSPRCERLYGWQRRGVSGIIRAGAKMVNAVANSVVPKSPCLRRQFRRACCAAASPLITAKRAWARQHEAWIVAWPHMA